MTALTLALVLATALTPLLRLTSAFAHAGSGLGTTVICTARGPIVVTLDPVTGAVGEHPAGNATGSHDCCVLSSPARVPGPADTGADAAACVRRDAHPIRYFDQSRVRSGLMARGVAHPVRGPPAASA